MGSMMGGDKFTASGSLVSKLTPISSDGDEAVERGLSISIRGSDLIDVIPSDGLS